MQNIYVPHAPLPAVAIPAPVAQLDPDTKRARYAIKIVKLGITEVVLGGVCCILFIGGIIVANQSGMGPYYHNYHVLVYISPGLWCGIFPIISGGLGIRMRTNKSPCMYNSNMTMSIISSVFMLILFILSLMTGVKVLYSPIMAIQYLLCACSLASFVVCIVHSVYCCGGVCKASENRPNQVVYIADQNVGRQCVVFVQSSAVAGQVYPVAVAAGSMSAPAPSYHVPQYPAVSEMPRPTPMFDPSKQGSGPELQQQTPMAPPSYSESPNTNPPQ